MRPAQPRVGGLTPLTTQDFPGRLAAVVFIRGCPWRCRYCHNRHLQARSPRSATRCWDDVLAFLRRRHGLLDGVVFSGGEPLSDAALAPAMQAIRRLGFSVGLHTAGIYPHRLARVLPFVDWVGLDIKTDFDDYSTITRIRNSGSPAQQSLRMLLSSGVDYEVRTTVHTAFHSEEGLLALAQRLSALGVRHYALQAFRSKGCEDAALNGPASRLDSRLEQRVRPLFASFCVRVA